MLSVHVQEIGQHAGRWLTTHLHRNGMLFVRSNSDPGTILTM